MTENQTDPSLNGRNGRSQNGEDHLIDLREVVKTFQTTAAAHLAVWEVLAYE